MKNNVLIIGSLNMDYTIYCDNFPKDGETIVGFSRFIQPGGKGANQAAAVAKSKLVNCYFLGCRGEDNDGEVIERLLSEIGVKTLIKKSKKETGNASITVNKASENQIIIISGANYDLLKEDIKDELLNESDFIILQNEIPEDTNAYVIKRAHELGKHVVYNPAPYRPIDEELFKCVDYLVVNETELMSYGKVEDIEKAIKVLLAKGVKNLIVTLGTKGSMFINSKERFDVPCYKAKAIDTVAAGDTYVGYFTAGLASGLNDKEAMDLAARASSITVSRKGSIASIPTYEEVPQ